MARSVVSLLAVVLLAQATFAVDFWYFYNGNWYPYRRDATRGYVLLPNTGKNGQPPNSPNTANVPPVNRVRTSSVQPAIAFAANGDLWYFYYGNWHAYRRNAKGEWVLLTNTVKNAVPPPPPVHNVVGSLPVNNGRAGYVQPPNAPAANIPQPPAAGKTSHAPLSSIVRRTNYASPVYNVRSGYAPPPYTYVLPQYAHAPPPPPQPSGNRPAPVPAPRYSPVPPPPPPPAGNKPAIQTQYNLPAPAAAPAPPRYAPVPPPPPPFGSMPAAPFQYDQLAPAPAPIDPFYPDGIKDFGVIPVADPLSVDPVSEPCNRPCLACECGDYECYKRKCDK